MQGLHNEFKVSDVLKRKFRASINNFEEETLRNGWKGKKGRNGMRGNVQHRREGDAREVRETEVRALPAFATLHGDLRDDKHRFALLPIRCSMI